MGRERDWWLGSPQRKLDLLASAGLGLAANSSASYSTSTTSMAIASRPSPKHELVLVCSGSC